MLFLLTLKGIQDYSYPQSNAYKVIHTLRENRHTFFAKGYGNTRSWTKIIAQARIALVQKLRSEQIPVEKLKHYIAAFEFNAKGSLGENDRHCNLATLQSWLGEFPAANGSTLNSAASLTKH